MNVFLEMYCKYKKILYLCRNFLGGGKHAYFVLSNLYLRNSSNTKNAMRNINISN